MKTLLSIVLIFNILFCFPVFAQDTSKAISVDLKPAEFTALVNRQFSKIITGQTNNTVGTYASFNPGDPTASFALSRFFENGDIFTARITGEVSDGFFEIFNNSELSSNVSISFQYHFIDPKRDATILFSMSDLYNRRYKQIDIDYNQLKNDFLIEKEQELKELEAKHSKCIKKIEGLETDIKGCTAEDIKAGLTREIKELEKVLAAVENMIKDLATNTKCETCNSNKLLIEINKNKKDLTKKRDSLKTRLTSIEGDKTGAIIKARMDSLSFEKQLAGFEKDMLNKKIQLLKKKEWKQYKSIELGNKTIEEEDANSTENMEIAKFKMDWWSVGYKVGRGSFKRFFPLLAPENQIRDTFFVSHEIKVQYSYYNKAQLNASPYFLTAGAVYKFRDNFACLKKNEINESNDYGQTVMNRSTTKKYAAYSGDYKSGYNELELNGELFYFILPDDKTAIHISPKFRVADKQKPVCDLLLGLVFAFPDSSKKGSLVNTELYYKMDDMFRVTEGSFNIFDRNSIGLRFTFPIGFNL